MLSLGISDGEYITRVSKRCDLVGSFDNPVKLIITDISSSRTEFKASPQCLTNSILPNEVSLNFEYINFIRKQVVIAHVYNELGNLIELSSFLSELENENIRSSTSDYDFYVKKGKELNLGLTNINYFLN